MGQHVLAQGTQRPQSALLTRAMYKETLRNLPSNTCVFREAFH